VIFNSTQGTHCSKERTIGFRKLKIQKQNQLRGQKLKKIKKKKNDF
jgi:hypothetical protein